MAKQRADLEGWLSYISQQHSQVIDMGLDRFNQVLQALELTRPAPTVITVAGTNGKGSTCRVIEALLIHAGYRVGTTLSPHIWRFNERIRINGVDASDEAICRAFFEIDHARGTIPLTYFEFAALAALRCMATAEVDMAILEIGLGGRLDAFNAIDADIAVITSIGLDHQAFLGDTLEAIGAEKAGILRAKQRAVLGQNMPNSVYRQCATLALEPRRWGQEFRSKIEPREARWTLEGTTEAPLDLPLTALAPHNVALGCEAVAELVVLDRELIERSVRLSMPGRLDICHKDHRVWVHDVCHNPAGAEFFMSELASRQIEPAFFICAMLDGKDHQKFVQTVKHRSAHGSPWLFVNSEGDRQLPGKQLAEKIGMRDSWASNMRQAVLIATQETHKGDAIVIFGSFSAVEQSPWLA